MASSALTMDRTKAQVTPESDHHYKVREETEKIIRPRQAETGMELSRDLLTDAGQLLFRDGTALSGEKIEKIKRFDIPRVFIKDTRTRWVNGSTYENLSDAVDVIDKKEVPPESNDDENKPVNRETFQNLFALIEQTEAPDNLRELLNSIEASAPKSTFDKNPPAKQKQTILKNTDRLEEHLKHVFNRLNAVDNSEDRSELLKFLFDVDHDELDLKETVPDDVLNAITGAVEQKRKTKTGLNDLIHNHSSLTENLNPEALNGLDINNGSRSTPSRRNDESHDFSDTIARVASEVSESDEMTDELLRLINQIGRGDVDPSTQSEPDQTNGPADVNDLDNEDLNSIQNALEREDATDQRSVQLLMEALNELEDGHWHSAIDQLDQSVSESNSVDQSSVRPLVDQSKQEQNKRSRLEDRLDTELEEKEATTVLNRLLAPTNHRTIEELKDQGIPHTLLDDLIQYQETIKSLAINACRTFSNKLPDILNDVDEKTRAEIIRDYERMVDRLRTNWLDINDQWDLYEKEAPAEGTVNKRSERIEDAMKQNDIEDLKQLTQLPDEVIEQYHELYKRPTGINKWQEKLIDSTEQLLNQFVLSLALPEQRIDRHFNQIKELYDSLQKPYSLLCSPPEPEHYHLVHAHNTCLVSVMMGLNRGLPVDATKALIPAALLADVGLSCIPSSLYLKHDELTQRGDNEIRKHPIYSSEIVKQIYGAEHSVTQLVAQHHERLDGSGYPNGLVDEALHPLCPFLIAADVFAARVENRIYRSSQMPDQVLKEMMSNTDRLNRSAIESIVECFGYYPNGSLVKLTNGQIAYVRKQVPDGAKNPEVLLLTDSNRRKLDTPNKLRLTDDESKEIELLVKT